MIFGMIFFTSLVEKRPHIILCMKLDFVFDCDGVSLELQMFVIATNAQIKPYGLRESKCSEKLEYT